MGTVTLSIEEYAELLAASQMPVQTVEIPAPAPRKRRGKKDPKMAKALREAHSKAKKKNGDFRKGYDQKKLMSLAHKIRRKMK